MSYDNKQLNKARQALVDRMLSRLDAGAIPWDNGMKGIAAPRNAVSGKHYRGMNLLNLMLAGKEDPRWITFNQATDAGYKVKKGAKGVPIELYKIIDKRTRKDADIAAIKEEIKDMTFAERQAFKKENLQSFARTYYVFNASDVAGIEPYRAPNLTPADISVRNERIERVIAGSQAPIFYDGNGQNFYRPTTDEIHLTDRAAFTSDEFFYNTALHEMAHSTGHSSRLNRPGGTRGSKEYAREELVAEIASVLTAAEFGLNHSDRVIENSAEYVRSWAQLIRDNPQSLIDATFDASRATDYICDAERQFEQSRENTQKERAKSGAWAGKVNGKLVIIGEWETHDISEHSNEPRSEQKKKTQKENAADIPPAPPKKPYEFKTNLDNIPVAMKALPNWIAFRTHEVYDEKDKKWKLKKVPITPNQPRAVSSSQYLKWADHGDPNTWSSFDNAVAFAKRWKLDGLAFAMQNSGMTCVDLDHHLVNGIPTEFAQKFIDAAGTTYAEKSVSGTGLHIFYSGQMPPGIKNVDKNIDLEAYDKQRFISMTGNLYGNATTEVLPPSDAMTGLLKDNLKRVEQHAVLPSKPLGLSDNELIELIRSKSSARDLRDFEAMWRGEDICGNRNVTDMKLCGILAFYSNGDVAQVERCFKASGLYRPPPEKSAGYVHRTAQKACDGRRAEYDPKAYAQRMNPNRTFAKPRSKPNGNGSGGNYGR